MICSFTDGGFYHCPFLFKTKTMKYFFVVLFLYSCSPEKQIPPEEEKLYISIDGKEIELVSDEYDNYYLKQNLPYGGVVYIPYTFPIEEEIPRVYEAKY